MMLTKKKDEDSKQEDIRQKTVHRKTVNVWLVLFFCFLCF